MAGPNWHLADDRKTVTDSFPSDPPIALKLEARDTRGLLGKLFGKGSVATLLIAGFLISGTAWAAEYTAFGGGTRSCGLWTESKKDDLAPYWQDRQWVAGYMTAYSLWVEDGSGPVNESDAHGGVAWIDNYCQENPLKPTSPAAPLLPGGSSARSLWVNIKDRWY